MSGMTSIGDTLRSERLRLGLDLDQVAERTKIGKRLLQAIEANEFEKLPGGVFTRSFVKQYARVLGLDEEAIGAEYKKIESKNQELPPLSKGNRSETEMDGVAPNSVVPNKGGSRIANLDPRSLSALVSAGWATLAIVVCAGVYYFLNHERVVAPKERAVVQDPVVTAQNYPPPSPVNDSVTNPVTNPVTNLVSSPVPPEQKSVVSESPAAVPSGVVQVQLKATEDSWISVTADGTRRFEGILQANESKQIDANKKVKVTAGNSGGLDIALNGKSIGPIGRSGEIRTVELTTDGAHVVRRMSSLIDPVL